MAIAFVQNVLFRTDGGSSVTGNTSATGSGNLLVMSTINTDFAETVVSVIDSAGNHYTAVPGSSATGSAFTQMWYCANCLSGATTVTVTLTGSTSESLICAFFEFSGAKTTSPVDSANAIANSSANLPPDSPTITPTVAGELLVAAITYDEGQLTGVNTGWTSFQSTGIYPQAAAYYINPPLSSQQAIWTPNSGNGDVATSIASFFPPSSGPSGAQKASMFLVA